MPQHSLRDEHGRPNLRTFENRGFLYGLAFGAAIGVLIAGPHFREWSFLASVGMILGCGVGFGLLGYVAIAIAYGSAAGGFGTSSGIGGDGSASGDGGDGGGGGGD